MTDTTIHHPSCPARHGEGPCTWYCAPEAEAEDQLILQHRTVDAMVLDVFTHATQALNDFHENTHARRGHRGLLAAVVLEAELPGRKSASWGVQA